MRYAVALSLLLAFLNWFYKETEPIFTPTEKPPFFCPDNYYLTYKITTDEPKGMQYYLITCELNGDVLWRIE